MADVHPGATLPMNQSSATTETSVSIPEVGTHVPRSPRRTTTQTHLSLRDITVHYGGFTAVRGVSFDIPRNRITALIGPSGCGKSTLLRAINRMNDLIPNATLS
jgi:phosphate transport system ATP-binding protein